MISNEKEFWTVGYSQWGRWQVRKAPVDQPDKYTLIEDLGPELKAAYLEADGDFIYKAGEEHLSLITSGVPWLFVITTSGKLYVKKVAEPLDTAILLASGVLQASPCRGWKSDEYDVDSGLAVAYRKSNGVYLRLYLEISGSYAWDAEQQILNQPVDNVEIRRLNDFRFGIYTTNPNHLFLSERSYIGSTAKTEHVAVKSGIDLDILSFTSVDGPHDDFRVTAVSPHGDELWVEGNYPFIWRDEAWNDISLTSGSGTQSILGYRIEDGLLKIKFAKRIDSPLAYVAVRVRTDNRIRFERTAQSKPIVPALDIVMQSPPIPYEETVAAVKTSLVGWQLRMKVQRLYKRDYEEHAAVSTELEWSVRALPVQDKHSEYSEHATVVSTLVNWSFAVQQTGDLPI